MRSTEPRFPTLAEAEAAFRAEFPDYAATAALDELRAREYARIDRDGHVFLDYTAGGLYARLYHEQFETPSKRDDTEPEDSPEQVTRPVPGFEPEPWHVEQSSIVSTSTFVEVPENACSPDCLALASTCRSLINTACASVRRCPMI